MATDLDAGPQPPDVAARSIVGLVFGFLVFVAASVAGLGVYYKHEHVGGTAAPRQKFPEPRLETRNSQDLGPLLKVQREQFQSYAWVDRGRGLVRIPVARAMEIIAARGAGAYDPPESPKAMPSPTSTPKTPGAPP
jgi:hypothetical protein